MRLRQPWLDEVEREEVLTGLIERGLVKWDNARQLKLKMGGLTDVYVTLRDARNTPGASAFVARVFEQPLRRMRAQRFAEVPDSVSGIAAYLSDFAGIPYVTIREKPKEGRVSKATRIGELVQGERVALIDDVMTDGASKEAPYAELKAAGIDPTLVILVDRQQGWQQKFAELGIDMTVWPGMTLHDVRAFLIRRGFMQRCDPKMEEKNPIILGLDGKPWDDTLTLMDKLRTSGCVLKVNDLIAEEGFRRIPDLQVYARRIMVDIKEHDIKTTAGNVARRLKKYNAWAVTVHASGGSEMIKSVVGELAGTDTKVLAVTVLTSIDPVTCEEIYRRLPLEQVMALAKIAKEAGAHGLVCSPEEVAALRSAYPNWFFVTPGIRSLGVDAGAQERIGSPEVAIKSGADHIVMASQVLGKPDPVAEIHRVLKEELGITLV